MSPIDQGPNVGRRFPAEMTTWDDPHTGTTVRKVTDARCHDHHLYFTNPGWYDEGTKVLISSDRTGRPNLFGVDLEDWDLVQLTDLPDLPPSEDRRERYPFPFLYTSVNPTHEEAYFWYEEVLVALDLENYTLRELWAAPDGYDVSITNVTADGTAVCTSLTERLDVDRSAGYGGFEETWAARPHSQVIEVPVNGGDPRVLHEEDYWIGHVNTSPTRADLLTFCHEGPWNRVDNRIWGLDRSSGDVWPIRERTDEDETVGHEFWLADGEHIGYHGRTAAGEPLLGLTGFDDTDREETAVDQHSWHFHAIDRQFVVGDGDRDTPFLLLYEWSEADVPVYRLARHRGSWHTQQLHVHPRLSPDGSEVLYTSDHLGYGDVYLADVPDDIAALPRLE